MQFVDWTTVKNDLEDMWKEILITYLKVIYWCSLMSRLEYNGNHYFVLILPLPDFEPVTSQIQVLNKVTRPYAAMNKVLLRIIFWHTQIFMSFLRNTVETDKQ